MSLEELVAAINARKAGVYHFTDTRNLSSIREHGLLSMAEIARRRIDTVPGGNQWSMDADKASGMDEYVHLCFMKDHPMVYYAQKEQRVDSVRYLRISPEVMLDPGALIVDQVSNKSGARPLPAREMISKIDWKVLYDRTDWKDPAIQARLKIAKVCELLVPKRIATDLIKNL